jgi:protoporphyrinogen oxidase
VKFPLQAKDLFLSLDRRFAVGAATDMAIGALPIAKDPGDSFASVLRANLGPTICKHFYFPYARKMWGRAPEQLSDIQAYKRVSSGTFRKLVKKVLKPPGAGRFYYPREGYGQISTAYANAARDAGATLMTETAVETLQRPAKDGDAWTVVAKTASGTERIEADHVWSTIPITAAAKMMAPAPPSPIGDAIGAIEYRAMVLVYIELDVGRFHETDAHYFPEENVLMTRLSEPKNYYGHTEPRTSTILCAEIPCDRTDEVFSMSDEALGEMLVRDMAKVDLHVPRPPVRTFSRRLPQAYPIYPKGYDKPLGALDAFVSDLPGFLTFGRQGLFAHDNLHHALFMAYCAVDCLKGETFDRAKWAGYREIFKSHVVED